MAESPLEQIRSHFAGHRELFARMDEMAPGALAAAERLCATLQAGGTVWLAGNGGSAADAQHLAAEMEGCLELERPARAVHSLGANGSTMSSIGNDFGFEHGFARLVKGFVGPKDLLWLFSTSGRSANLIAAAQAAKSKGAPVLAFLGKGGGPLAALCDLTLVVPSDDTQWIQEAHITLGHAVLKLVDRILPAPED